LMCLQRGYALIQKIRYIAPMGRISRS